MTKHFASSWLVSLTSKLEALTEWSWQADRRGDCTTHRNLFREFFSAQFGKTLALVDEIKKTEFLGAIERNLYKFDGDSQQYPLICLCALLQHGKDSKLTQEKICAWVGHVLEKLRRPAGALNQAVEECLSAPFKKFLPLMEVSARNQLADGLGERLAELNDDLQRRVLDELEVVPARVEEVVVNSTQELNNWLASAPRFPSTPLSLADALAKMEHPLVRFFTSVKQPARKEAFLVSVALALQSLRTRFRWMCTAEPDLESLGGELQRKLFTVEGQGPVMELWLTSRLKKYNSEVAAQTAQTLAGNIAKSESLRRRLEAVLPDPECEADDAGEGGWVALDGPSQISDTLLEWLCESSPTFFCPQHTLARDTLTGVLLRYSSTFEVDVTTNKARRRRQVAFAPGSFPKNSANSAPPLMAGQPANSQAPPATMSSDQLPAGIGGARPDQSPEVDNLVDLLLNEALEGIAPTVRAQIHKLSHGIYRMGTKEVTLHTNSGRLYVYRVGEVVRHVPIQTLLQEEGLIVNPAAGPPGTTAASTVSTAPALAGAPVDSSAVAKIAMQSKRISAGVTTTTSNALATTVPFGSTRQPEATSLMNKRVEAATKAMDISKQIVLRSVNFGDEKLLRKLLTKGLKGDSEWQEAYQDYCTSRGIADTDHKNQNKEFVADFIEKHLANSINKDWAQKIIYPAAKGEGEKKDKKDKKNKKEKKKKRKTSESSTSAEGPGGAAAGVSSAPAPSAPAVSLDMPEGQFGGLQHPAPINQHCPPVGDPMAFPAMFGGMPFGMGMPGGMMGPVPPMFGDGMLGMGLGDERQWKRSKKEDRSEKPSKKDKTNKIKK